MMVVVLMVVVVGGVGADGGGDADDGADFHRCADFDEGCQTIIILRQILLLDIPVMDFLLQVLYLCQYLHHHSRAGRQAALKGSLLTKTRTIAKLHCKSIPCTLYTV